MYSHQSPYIASGEQLTASRILADAITSDPDEFSVSDYSLFTTMFWNEEPGSPEARTYFFGEMIEKLGKLDGELIPNQIDPEKAIEQYGDFSFCVFALDHAFGVDTTKFVKDLWKKQGFSRSDPSEPAYVTSVINSGAVEGYRRTRYGTFTWQPYENNLLPWETQFDHRKYQIGMVENLVDPVPISISDAQRYMAQQLVGYTLADLWLGETKRVAEALDSPQVMIDGMATSMNKLLAAHVENV